LFQVVDGCFSNRVDAVVQPCDADRAQLVVEEVLSQLASEDRELLYDWQLNSPVFILAELGERRDNWLGQVLYAEHLVHIFQSLEKVESDIRAFISQQQQKDGQDMLVSGRLFDDGTKSQNVFCESTSHILELVCLKLFQAWDYLRDDVISIHDLAKVG
jgi:hypothetical protein